MFNHLLRSFNQKSVVRLSCHTDHLDVVLPVALFEVGKSLVHQLVLLALEFDLHVLRNQVSHEQKGLLGKCAIQLLAYFWKIIDCLQKLVHFGKLDLSSRFVLYNIGHRQLSIELWLLRSYLRVDYVQDSQANGNPGVRVDLFIGLRLRHLSYQVRYGTFSVCLSQQHRN